MVVALTMHHLSNGLFAWSGVSLFDRAMPCSDGFDQSSLHQSGLIWSTLSSPVELSIPSPDTAPQVVVKGTPFVCVGELHQI